MSLTMSTTAGSFSNLSFDSPLKMKHSLVEAFFDRYSKKFGAWHSGVYRCENPKQVVKDSQNNEIFLFHYALHQRKSISLEWLSKSKLERAHILLKIATKLEESSELIGQIEHVVRGILPRDTKACVTQIANYFRYYSSLTNLDCGEHKIPKFHFMFHFTNVASILVLAQIAQCFASGRSVAFLVDKDVAALGILFIELCHEAGVTKELFSIIPTVEAPVEEFPDVLFNESTSLSWGTTMAVYESSDLDSAVEIVTRAAWDQKGLLPWALKQILIQESVYESFITKLSKKIKEFTWELPEAYNLDDSTKKMIDNVEKVLEKATKHGVKHLPMHSDFTTGGTRTLFKPVVLLDNVPPYFWDKSSGIPTPVVTVQSFRTTKEAVSLINNTASFALSIWGNNITVSNELALAANVSNVWINSFGLVNTDVALKDNQNLNCSFLGGQEGFDSNLTPDFGEAHQYENDPRFQYKDPQISSEVEKISKLQAAWAKTTKEKKVSSLLAIAKCLEHRMSHWSSLQTKDGKINSEDAPKLVEKSIKYIKFAALVCEQLKNTCSVNPDKTMCLEIREPIGVIFVDDTANTLLHFVYVVVAATIFGNGVLYRTHSGLLLELCKEFSSVGIPVVTVEDEYNCDPKFEIIKATWLIGHHHHAPASALNRPNICWDEAYGVLERNIWDKTELKMRFSNVKNIWSTFGETFAN